MVKHSAAARLDVVTAAIYCRISQDRPGDELGVERQRTDCVRLAKQRGWTVGAVYTDNDVSAFSGRRRPEYERMIDDLASGAVQAVIAWHPDRLHRSPLELERFISVVENTGAAVATVQAGELDLSSAAGRMTARVVGAVARHESEQKSERIRRQREQQALQGRPHGGRRAFGYDATGSKVVEEEGALVREAVDRYLAGESLRSIARDWNRRGIPPVYAKTWTIPSLRFMLGNPRLAALRVHRGEVVAPATWPAIISREEHELILARMGSNPREHRVGRPPTSLLGGLVRCGHCGGPLHSSKRTNGQRRYACNVGAGAGCGRLAIQAAPLEELVTEVVIARLDTPELAEALREKPTAKPIDDESEIERRRAELADLYAAGEVTKSEWLRARVALDGRLAKAREKRTSTARVVALSPYRKPGALRAAWPELETEQRREILDAVIGAVRIAPASRPGAPFEGSRVSIDWRA